MFKQYQCYVFQRRFFAKALKRRTVRVLSSEEADKFHKKHVQSEERRTKLSAIECGRGTSTGILSDSSSSEVVSFTYEKLLPGDKRFGPIINEAKSSAGRSSKGLILLEGKRLLREAIQTKQELKSIYFTHTELLNGFPVHQLVASGTKFYKVKPNHVRVWSDTVTSQGVMAVCKLPKTSHEKSRDKHFLPITLVCDVIRDPGMLGTLLRSAVAACCSSILITRDCVDVWEPKVLRSGAGAHFHTHSLITGLRWELAANYLSSNSQVFLVGPQYSVTNNSVNLNDDPDEPTFRTNRPSFLARLPSKPLDEIQCTGHAVTIVVTDSPSTEACKLVMESQGCQLQFPTNGNVGMLNSAIAGSIALFEFARQLRLRTAASVSRDDERNE